MLFEAAKDHAPTAHPLILGRTTKLCACQRAHYTIETITKGPLNTYLQSLRFSMEEEISKWYPLLYGLTATHRAEGGQQHRFTDEDRELGFTVPSSFVATLPTGQAWLELITLADNLMAAAWSDPAEEVGPEDPTRPGSEVSPSP